ncbi:hypothetical protein GO491_06570 [Flavobacteriaceae bacterium Ap0902]|nr:hypothetical protein [Flavobacteriaceae bacterium Ap0902]
MIQYYSKYAFIIVLLLLCFISKAQDTTSFYDKIENQQNPFRVLNQSYYYNPANMQDYSNLSYTNIYLNYYNQDQETYLLQRGKSKEKYRLFIESYKIMDNETNLWGEASYTDSNTKDIQWNNNLDLDKISPFVIADAVGGNIKTQSYQFRGGISKNIQKLTLGADLKYKAKLSYKTTDPRPKNTVSDLHIALGSRYLIMPKYHLGLAVKLNRYIQTSSIKFSSEIEQTPLYHLNGLGTYHYYFSNRSTAASFKDFTQEYILTWGSQEKNLHLTAGTLFSNFSKEAITTSNTTYQSNSMDKHKLYMVINKLFPLNEKIKLGGKISFDKTSTKGKEIYYTNNTSIVEKLLEKQTYQQELENYYISSILEYKNKNFSIFLEPYIKFNQNIERKLDIDWTQNFKYNFIGINLFYLQPMDNKNMFSLNTTLYQRHIHNNPNLITTNDNDEINNWQHHDFLIKNLNYYAIESFLRYDRNIDNYKSIYVTIGYHHYYFSNTTNNRIYSINLGVTF